MTRVHAYYMAHVCEQEGYVPWNELPRDVMMMWFDRYIYTVKCNDTNSRCRN